MQLRMNIFLIFKQNKKCLKSRIVLRFYEIQLIMENELGRNDKKNPHIAILVSCVVWFLILFFEGEGSILVVLSGLTCKVNRPIRKFEKEEYLAM